MSQTRRAVGLPITVPMQSGWGAQVRLHPHPLPFPPRGEGGFGAVRCAIALGLGDNRLAWAGACHMFDLLIRDGLVVDGTSRVSGSARRADVAVQAGRIAAVEPLPPEARAHRELRASGLVVAPGFIDIHTHADIALLAHPTHEPKVMQGVTTEVFSNCGLGFAPVTDAGLAIQRDYLLGLFGDDAGVDWGWRTVAELLERYRQGIGTNVAYLIPHGSVRVSVMGMAQRPATPDEVAAMVRLVRQGMEQGAWGLSTGLWYAPMSAAERSEMVALCRAVAEYGGFYAIHMRDYADRIADALDEAIETSAASGCAVQVSHLQMNGAPNWGRAPEALAVIDRARAQGLDVTFDSYPYTAGSTLVQALLPAWVTEGGSRAILERLRDPDTRARVAAAVSADPRDWSRVVLCGARTARNQAAEGETFTRLAESRGVTVGELVCALLEEEDLQACFIAHQADERDVRAFLAHPAQMVGSDGLHLPGKTHPRLFGAFPRLLARYVREERLLSLEEAVYKMAGAPAARLGWRDRGCLRPGAAADIVVFDPAAIRDTATYDDPCRYPEGIPWVIVNGTVVKEGDRHTGALAGCVLAAGR
ncbi:MAG: D-aminoacylase [Armatimonadetes bacterium]|nr:D-aminoacylase [Armatimonadota bacterium]